MTYNTQHIPSGIDTRDALLKRLHDGLTQQIHTADSLLRQSLGGSFSNETEIKFALIRGLRAIWESGTEASIQLGFAGELSPLEREGANVQKELEILANQLYVLLKPLRKIEDGKWVYDFDSQEGTLAIVDRLERETQSLNNATHLMVGEIPQTPSMVGNQLLGFLKHAPERIRGLIRKKGYPAQVNYTLFRENPISQGLATIIQTATFVFMTYGWHGLAYNAVDSIARKERLSGGVGGGLAEGILSHPILEGMLTYGTGLTAATLIGYGLVAGTRRRRGYLIQDAEASAQANKPVKVGNWIDRNGLFALSLSIAVLGAGMEGAGILSHEVKGYYTTQKAAETAGLIAQTLDVGDANSIAGKGLTERNKTAKEITQKARIFYESELSRPGAPGEGPAAVAKKYLFTGPTVLNDPKLSGDTKLKGIVETTDSRLRGYKSHADYPTFEGKAAFIAKLFEADITTLGQFGTATYNNVAKMRGRAQSTDLFRARDEFKEKVGQFMEGQRQINTKWGEITGIYQQFINSVAAGADAKYKSRTAFNANFQVNPPDLSNLLAKLEEKPPELEGRNPIEYFEELDKLVGKEGGISNTEKWGILLFVFARSGLLELASGGKLMGSIRRIRKYYSRPNNLPSKKMEDLTGLYDTLIDAVHESFSGSNWQAIFPSHPGISRNEAEYIVRNFLVKRNPLLEKHLPVHHTNSGEQISFQVSKIGHQVIDFYRKILTGDSRTNHEQFLHAMNTVLSELATEAQNDNAGIGISMKAIHELMSAILPTETVEHLPDRERFNAVCHTISRNLDELHRNTSQTLEDEAEKREKEIQSRIQSLQTWVDITGELWKGTINTTFQMSVRDSNSTELRQQCGIIYDRICVLGEKLKAINAPNIKEVWLLEGERDEIIQSYTALSNSRSN